MSDPAVFEPVYRDLKAILDRHTGDMKGAVDRSGIYTVNGTPADAPDEHVYFGGVRLGKAYVSYYLMPVYMNPRLLEGISPDLRKRMQGKSCFNFRRNDEALLGELERLTERSAGWFREQALAGGSPYRRHT
jgi:hypothetical protein